jgi:hypothetical protein
MVLLFWSTICYPVSSLNGGYKIELVKAKCQYLEHRNQPNFEPTDIMPLVNKAFKKALEIKKCCKGKS